METFVETSAPWAQAALASAMNYSDYRKLVDNLLLESKSTNGDNSESTLHYTSLNVQRMKRLDKTTKVLPDVATALENLQRPMIWLVLTEGWCGDAAQIVPVLAAMETCTTAAAMRFILRDQHLDVMDNFLTNGGRAIPKIIVLDAETLDVLGDWGPRPAALQKIVLEAKAEGGERWANFKTETQVWYTKDKTVTIQREFLAFLQGLA